MKNLILSLFTLALLLASPALFAQNTDNEELTTDIKNPPVKRDGQHLVNVDENGVILRGYDVIAFHTENKPLKGSPDHKSEFQGAVYHFASAENKAIFDTDPAKYIPQFGGFCAVAVSLGKLSAIQLWTHSIVDGRLLFNHNKKAKALWDKNVAKHLKRADANWPKVSQRTKYN